MNEEKKELQTSNEANQTAVNNNVEPQKVIQTNIEKNAGQNIGEVKESVQTQNVNYDSVKEVNPKVEATQMPNQNVNSSSINGVNPKVVNTPTAASTPVQEGSKVEATQMPNQNVDSSSINVANQKIVNTPTAASTPVQEESKVEATQIPNQNVDSSSINVANQKIVNTPTTASTPVQEESKVEQTEEATTFTPVEEALANEPFEEEVINPTPVMDSYKKEEVKPKKEKNKMVPILLGVILFLVAVIAILYFVFNNSKNLFLGAINKEYTQLISNNHINSFYEDTKKSSIVTEGNVHINISDTSESVIGAQGKAFFDELNKLNIHYSYGMDYKNKNMAYLMGITYNQKDMLKINMYAKEKNIYYEYKDLFSKYIKIPYEELDNLFEDPNATIEDLEIVTKSMKDAFLNSLESKDFKSSKETIKIENKDEKVKKIAYVINKENVTKIVTSMAESLKQDKKFVSLLSKYSNKKESEINESLDTIIKNAKEKNYTNEDFKEITLAIYFKGITNKAVQYEIKNEDSNTSIFYQKGDKQKTLTFLQDEDEIMTFVNEKKSTKLSKTTIAIPSLNLEGIIEKSTNENGNTYDLTFRDSKDTFKITGKYIGSNKKEGNTISSAMDLSLKMETQNEVFMTVKVTADGTGTIGKSVTMPENFENSVEIKDLTEVESNEILNNMMKNETLMQFINVVSDMTGMNTNAYTE